ARRTHAAVVRADEGLVVRVGLLRGAARRPLLAAERRLASADSLLRSRPGQLIDAEQRHVDGLAARVRSADPAVMLRRGWTITRAADGTIVRSPGQVGVGEDLVTEFSDGRVRSTVVAHDLSAPRAEADDARTAVLASDVPPTPPGTEQG